MPDQPRWVRGALWAGVVGVLAYVGSWLLAGWLRAGYDPTEQAISELFELGAPAAARAALLAGLVLSGLAMVVLAPALHLALPGRGRLGPGLVLLAGLGTLGVAAAPCTAGCPGPDASLTDAAHSVAAATGYLALVAAPLAFAPRLHGAAPRLAVWSWTLGGVALAGLAVRYLGLVEAAPGLQQRFFNTVADAWYLLVAWWLLRGRVR